MMDPKKQLVFVTVLTLLHYYLKIMKNKSDKYWSTKLDKFSYKILREAGTEMPSENTICILKMVFINAKDAEINC